MGIEKFFETTNDIGISILQRHIPSTHTNDKVLQGCPLKGLRKSSGSYINIP